MKQRIAWIDAGKAMCIWFVVWCHFVNYSHTETFVYSWLAQMMLFLSGYLFKPVDDVRAGAVKRVKSLLVPYWFALVLWYPFAYFFLKQPPLQWLDELCFFSGRLAWHTPLWYLPTLFETWLACAILWKIKPGKALQYVAAAVCILMAMLMPRSLSFLKSFGILRSMACMPIYLFGYWAREWRLVERVRERPWTILPLLIAGVVCGMVINGRINIYNYTFETYPALLGSGLAMSLVFSALFSYKASYPAVISVISGGTIFIMSTHMPFVMLYREYLEPWVMPLGEVPMVLICAALAVTMVGAQALLIPQVRKSKAAATLFGLR